MDITRMKKGFTIIEVIVGVLILSMLVLGVYSMYDYALKIVKKKGLREEAISIAYNQMEYLRSIDYETLGVIGGPILCNPSCIIPSEKDVTPNKITFTVYTYIKTVDDSFDGLGDSDDNNAINDYKKARVKVCWTKPCDDNYEELISTFAPVGIETNCVEGTLKITVLDANAAPIEGAQVHIQNDNTTPTYDFTDLTNVNGVSITPCLKQETNNTYKITINNPDRPADYNSDYSTAQTCPFGSGTPRPICPKPSPYGLVNVNDLHLNVSDGAITTKTFYIDLLSVLNVQTLAQNVPDKWNVNDTDGDGDIQDMPTVGIGPGDSYYFFWRSDHGGQTRIWGQKYDSNKTAMWNGGNEKQISTSNNQILPNTVVSPTNGDVYLVWYDDSSGNQDVYIKKLQSADGDDDANWTGSKKLSVATANQNADQTFPQINLEDGENFFYLTFQDNTNDTNDIYVARRNAFDDSELYCDEDNVVCVSQGATCGVSGRCVKWNGETKINDDSVGNTQTSPATLIEPETDNLYIVWNDDRNGNFDIYGQKIDPDGSFDAVWNVNIKINKTNSEEQSYPDIAISDENGTKYLYIVWQDFRNANDYDIYLAKYNTDGARVFANDIELTAKDTTDADQISPSIAINSDNEIYVAWVDKRNGNQDVYLQKFDINGVAQWTYDLLVNNDQNKNVSQDAPQLTIDSSGDVVIVWQDDNSGDYDIKAATFNDPNITPQGNVPLRIYGAKTIGDDGINDVYKFDDNTFVTDSSGNLDFDGNNQNKLEWDIYNFEITGGVYQLWQTEPTLPINIGPNTTNTLTLILKSTDPPAAITDLDAKNPEETSIQLDWTAPGEHGSAGVAASYDIRYSTSDITSETEWLLAASIDTLIPPAAIPTPSAAGAAETVTVTGLTSGNTYYFAVKTTNNDLEISPISNIDFETTIVETIPPADITDLTLSNATTSSIDLQWTAPADDGATGDSAASYDIRYSTNNITNENEWIAAASITTLIPPATIPDPAPPTTFESLTVTGLDPATQYYFAIKTSDEVPNESGLSNIPSLSTLTKVFRATEYFIDEGNFTGVSYNLTLNQDLKNDYFVIVQGSDGNGGGGGNRGPDENYIALSGDPFGTGDLNIVANANILTFNRNNAESSWVGVITVVECLANCSTDGFELRSVENVVHNNVDTSGSDTSAVAWSDINQTMLLGGFNGSGCITQAASVAQHKSCHVKIYPSGSNVINWERNSSGATLATATTNVMVIEWGSNWTIQRVNVVGNNGGNRADSASKYDTAPLSIPVARDNTWVWGTGWTNDDGIGDASEGTLITLGDGVNQNTTESTVAVGQEYSDNRNFEVYALTHPDLAVDYRFKSDGHTSNLIHDMTFDAATDSEARMALIYNGSNGTGDAYPRPIWSARYIADTIVQLRRRRSGQPWPAWVQGIDFSGI